MLPEIIVHRPRGVLPKLAVRQRVVTVVDYQPSWVLLAIPAVAVLRARKRSRVRAEPPPVSAAPDIAEVGAAPTSRRRPVQVLVASMSRLRRRPMPPTPVPEDHVVHAAPVTPGLDVAGGDGLADSPPPPTTVLP